MSLRVAVLFIKTAYVKRPLDVLFCRQLTSHAAVENGVLRTPVYLQHKMRQLRRKLLEEDRAAVQRRSRQGNARRPVVSCRRPQFNWNWGQTTPDQPLASAGWARARSHGDHFTVRRLADAPPPLEADPFPAWLDPRLLAALEARGILQPSPVQSECLAVLCQERERPVLCLAEAGSGKTLAYLLPLLQGLLEGGEQALVVAPSRELAAQLAHEARGLAQACGLGARLLLAGGGRRPSGPGDNDRLLVSTPGGLSRVDVRRVGRLVLDEVDTLLDDSFRPAALHITQSVRPGAQLVLVGAARPSRESLDELLGGAGGQEKLVWVRSPQLHRLLPHVEHRLVRVRAEAKAGALVELVKRHASSSAPSPQLVFANSSAGCHWLAHLLRAQGLRVACLHGDLPAQERQQQYRRFVSGEATVLVCTDLASRGLDVAGAQQVVNFELPTRAADYLHRAGRVGRLRGAPHARVVSLVASRADARLAQSIERAAREAQPVEDARR